MTRLTLTLLDLFASGGNGVSTETLSRMESCDKMCQLKRRVSSTFIGVPWAPTLCAISTKALEIFHLSIPEILVRAWNKYRILLDYTDENKYPPGTTKDVDLVSHTVKSVHHPRLEIIVNGVQAHEIEFEIELSLLVHGMVLTVQDGRVKQISAGNIRGEMKVSCEECEIIKRETGSFEFLRPLPLGEGIPIRPSAPGGQI